MRRKLDKPQNPPLSLQWATRNDRPRVRLAVCGSRTLKDERVRILLLEEIEAHNITDLVTHGEPEGVCGVARDIAKQKAIPLTLHHLNFQYMRGAFEHRTMAVFLDCDRTILIHDGISRGTSNELKVAMKMKIPYSYHVLEPSKYKTSVGFDIETEWGLDPLEREMMKLEELV